MEQYSVGPLWVWAQIFEITWCHVASTADFVSVIFLWNFLVKFQRHYNALPCFIKCFESKINKRFLSSGTYYKVVKRISYYRLHKIHRGISWITLVAHVVKSMFITGKHIIIIGTFVWSIVLLTWVSKTV